MPAARAPDRDGRLADWLVHIQRLHPRSIDLTLDRARRVAARLGLEAPGVRIAVAGTNGKGSSVAFLESVYRAAGYRTAAYTSPHLVRYNERVRVNGAPAPDRELKEAFRRVESARAGVPLTYFEFGTLAALEVFRRHDLDVSILEVGMGGRLDAVNIVDNDAALITEIGLDHQRWLGDTLKDIAREKAGIARAGRPVIASGRRAAPGLRGVCERRGCEFRQLEEGFDYEIHDAHWRFAAPGLVAGRACRDLDLPLPRAGRHQVQNAAGAVAVVERLRARLPVAATALERGIRDAPLPGRCQVLEGRPRMILDVSHNAGGIEALASFLAATPCAGATHGVFSMLDDKDVDAAVRGIARRVDCWYVAPLDSERAAAAPRIRAAIGRAAAAPVAECEDLGAAFERAAARAGERDRIVVFGSFLAVGDIMGCLGIDPYPRPSRCLPPNGS